MPAILAAILYGTYSRNRLFTITLILLCFVSVLIPGSVTSCVTIFVLGVSYIFFQGYRKLKLANYAILFSTVIFFLIYVIPVLCIDINNDFYFVPYALWRLCREQWDRKYFTKEYLDEFKIKFNGAVNFLDMVNGKKVEDMTIFLKE